LNKLCYKQKHNFKRFVPQTKKKADKNKDFLNQTEALERMKAGVPVSSALAEARF